MKFSEYLRSKGITLSFLGLGAVFLAIFLIFGEAGFPMLLTAEGFLMLTVILWLICGYLYEKARFDKLERLKNELEDKSLLGEILPSPVNAAERRYFDIVKIVSRSALGKAEQAMREKEEYCSYVESWIHEIKTPLTACSLILENDADPRRQKRELKKELKRADNLTESILYYARMRTAEKDTRIKETHAANLMEDAVKSQMEVLIAANISVETEGDFIVFTDGKAVVFMLKQFLINCAKYCPGCHITMTAGEDTISVRDNGIGIPDYEISRVTDRGFTGTNGRAQGSSTGMGLYLVKELCGRLGIELIVESELSEYTRMILRFRNKMC